MKKLPLFTSILLSLTLALATAIPFPSTPAAASAAPAPTPARRIVSTKAAGRTVGQDILVGSFKLHVQIQQQRVTVQERGGQHAAAVPATRLLVGPVSWNPTSKVISFDVGVTNTGAMTLFGPVRAHVLKLASPDATPVNPDGGSAAGSWNFAYGSELLGGEPRLSPGETSGKKPWRFHSPTAKAFQVDVEVRAGVPLPAGVGGTFEGEDGTSVTVEPNSIPYEVLIDSEAVPASGVVAPLGQLEFAGAVNVTFEPTDAATDVAPPAAPLQISVPAPANPTASQFVVGQQLPVDDPDAPTPGLTEQLVAADTAALVGGQMVTEASVFPGVFGGGLFVFVANHGSGFATGTVSDAGGPRSGAVVSNNTNTLVSLTDGAGRYHLYINGGPFSVTAFDPFRGSRGTTAGDIAVSGSTVTANIPLTPLTAPVNTRDGVRNGGFERGDISSWTTTGAAAARQQLGPTSTGVVIRPTEGQWMADINTGTNSVGGVGSGLKQRFVVPAGVRTFRFDFNFVSEEFPEFVGSVFDDSFRALVTTPNGQTTFAQVSVNQSQGFSLIGDCGFPGGDSTCGQTGWRQGSVNLAAFSGTGTPITVELLFSSNDAGDNIYDTHVLIDNMRFSTVWIDAKIISGASASLARVQQEIRNANEILSQAGINIQLRNVQTVADPGGLLDTDVTFTGTLTAEESTLLGISRSATATDVNYYYVRSLTGLAALAIACGPDDFSDVNILTNSGIIMSDTVTPETLAHELGHILISPDNAGSTLEHSVSASNNIMKTPRTVPRDLVNRHQSANINRAGAPLLLP
ncbi:MAG TPA: hypothetical protein VN282_20785 [Pyrinomonadaceae bacterium]|nr:hypothetical protein [Pyrinomonadaceae bacterium]